MLALLEQHMGGKEGRHSSTVVQAAAGANASTQRTSKHTKLNPPRLLLVSSQSGRRFDPTHSGTPTPPPVNALSTTCKLTRSDIQSALRQVPDTRALFPSVPLPSLYWFYDCLPQKTAPKTDATPRTTKPPGTACCLCRWSKPVDHHPDGQEVIVNDVMTIASVSDS